MPDAQACGERERQQRRQRRAHGPAYGVSGAAWGQFSRRTHQAGQGSAR